MTSIRLTSLLTTAALAGAAVLSAAPAQAAPTGTQSLATVLAADGNKLDGNWGDFDIVDKAVHAVLAEDPGSDVAVLADGDVALTAFVPTDRAFRKLVEDLTGDRKHTEKGVLGAVVAAAGDVETLEAILLYHVVPGATITYKQAMAADGLVLDTALPDGTIQVRIRNDRVALKDVDTDSRNPRVMRTLKNLNKGNVQIAHGIDRVLRPIDL